MQRREFFSVAAAGSLVASAGAIRAADGSTVAGEGAVERRFGDVRMRRAAEDRFELRFAPDRARPLRLLQLTDTHFHPGDETNRATETMLRGLVERERPDFIVHTGDFVNNDSDKPVDWTGLDVLAGLRRPWTLCFGNHDYPVRGAPGSLSLDQIHSRMEHGFQGHFDDEGRRRYAYRYDVIYGREERPRACLFFFQVGYAKDDRRISASQLAWFDRQMAFDAQRRIDGPITVFVHIPLIEYDRLFAAGRADGKKGEDVCYDSDTGASFESFAKSGRVVAVFCGHDHVNNYHGDWQGVDLTYGRVSGWGGYGPADWKRGGRLLTFDLESPRPAPRHSEVF